jgi:hypothetical protein
MPLGYVATTNFAITLTSLAALGARESAVIDNSTNKYDDYMINLKIAVMAVTGGTLADSMGCNLYLSGSADGTNFSEPATGTDAAIIVSSTSQLRYAGFLMTPSNFLTDPSYFALIPSVANCFGGIVPKKFTVVVENRTNYALNGTATNFEAWWTGVILTT